MADSVAFPVICTIAWWKVRSAATVSRPPPPEEIRSRMAPTRSSCASVARAAASAVAAGSSIRRTCSTSMRVSPWEISASTEKVSSRSAGRSEET